MIVGKFVPASFIYVQGLSLANPIYLVFLSLFFKKCFTPIFRPSQLVILLALLNCQFLAILASPHELPMSTVPTLLGLVAFTVRPDLLFSWNGTDDRLKTYRRIFFLVLLTYFLDSLVRIQYLHYNWTDWPDWELKQLIKTSSWLADDTNTLSIRVVLLYFIARSISFLISRPWVLRGIFLYLALSCYSRAALAVLLLVFVLEAKAEIKMLKMKYLFLFVMLGLLIFININLPAVEVMALDSSAISKLDLVIGSFYHWLYSGWWERLFGAGYFSNIDVGSFNWASGHSIVYYALVDFGVLGTLLLAALIFRCARSVQARWLLTVYIILGFSVFRFDFLFLYIALFFVEYTQAGSKSTNSIQVSKNF